MILLISDLHLQEERPDLTRAFVRFLEDRAVHAQALYILGDFFEVWVGDDGASAFQLSIASALKKLSDTGVAVYLMHGNRDFLIGRRFCKAAGATLLADPSLVQFGQTPVLLMHGDSLCTLDESYMRMRRLLRNPVSLFILRHLPLAKRQQLARNLRTKSKQQTRMKAQDIIDVTPSEVVRVMQKYAVQHLVHGHTHRPAVHTLDVNEQAATRIVLGDWDRLGWVLEWDEHGFKQRSFNIPA